MKYWQIKAKADTGQADLLIYGDISTDKWYETDVTPTAMRQELDKLGDVQRLNIYINSGGGNVFAGNAIYNMLKAYHAPKIAYIDGLAASAASVVAMAADKVVMPKNSLFMIHKPWTAAVGNTDELLKQVELLERLENGFVAIYQQKTGLEEKVIRDMLAAETWFSADEAVKYKFADETDEAVKVAACVSGSVLEINGLKAETDRYKNFPVLKMPKAIPIEPVQAPEQKHSDLNAVVTAEEINKFLRGEEL